MAREKSLDEKLYESRIIVLCGGIGPDDASAIMLQLLRFSAEDEKEDIHLYFGTSAGRYLDMLAIYDTIRSIPNDVTGTCIGKVTNFTALLLASCTKGKRYALEHSEFALDQPNGILDAGSNQQTEIAIAAKEATNTREIFEALMAEATSQDVAKIHADCEYGIELTASEAKEYGIIDVILKRGE